MKVQAVEDALPLGARMTGACVTGVTHNLLNDEAVYSQLNELLANHGVIVFDGVEVVEDLQFDVVSVFGPRKEHPARSAKQAAEANGHVFEIDGKTPSVTHPWHVEQTDLHKHRADAAGAGRTAKGRVVAFGDGIPSYRHLAEAIQPAEDMPGEGNGLLRSARNLAQIERDMTAAEMAFAHAEERLHQAQRDRDAALVAINRYQAEIDGIIIRLRERSPAASTWQGLAGGPAGVLMLEHEVSYTDEAALAVSADMSSKGLLPVVDRALVDG